jgi:hypothetical protein
MEEFTMVALPSTQLPALYEDDETAWLETMAELFRERRFDELDYASLFEYLSDMARRDRREVESRLKLLIAHLLKWTCQPEKRSGSWRATIEDQREELVALLESGTLRRHAATMLAKVYSRDMRRVMAETDLSATSFPKECPYTLEQLESEDLLTK